MIGHPDAICMRQTAVIANPGQRPANIGNRKLASEPHYRAKDAGQQVRVLVRIEMSRSDAGSADLFNLSVQLGVSIDLLKNKLQRSLRKTPSVHKRTALHKHQMAAHVESWCFPRQPNRIIKGIAIRHQGGRCKNSFAMRLNNAGIHIPREAEVIGVNKEPLHCGARTRSRWIEIRSQRLKSRYRAGSVSDLNCLLVRS